MAHFLRAVFHRWHSIGEILMPFIHYDDPCDLPPDCCGNPDKIHDDRMAMKDDDSVLHGEFKELVGERDELLSILRKICGQHAWQNLSIGPGSTHEWARNILDQYDAD